VYSEEKIHCLQDISISWAVERCGKMLLKLSTDCA
jgi:hypothetical protein